MILSKLEINNSKYKKKYFGKIIKTQRVTIKCDNCERIYSSIYLNVEKCREKYKNDLCGSCKQKFQYSHGLREKQRLKTIERNKIMFKDKTFEEYYGKEKSEEIKNKLSLRFSGKNNPMYGRNDQCYKEHGIVNINKSLTGKTYEEIHGKEKAKIIKEKISLNQKAKIIQCIINLRPKVLVMDGLVGIKIGILEV